MLAAETFETDLMVLAAPNFVFLRDLTDFHLRHSYKSSIRDETAIHHADNVAILDDIFHHVVIAIDFIGGLTTNLIAGRIGRIGQFNVAEFVPDIGKEALSRTVARARWFLRFGTFELNDCITHILWTGATLCLDVLDDTIAVRAVQEAVV